MMTKYYVFAIVVHKLLTVTRLTMTSVVNHETKEPLLTPLFAITNDWCKGDDIGCTNEIRMTLLTLVTFGIYNQYQPIIMHQ